MLVVLQSAGLVWDDVYVKAGTSQLYLRTVFILSLAPLPPGGPREGPDCHFLQETVGFGPIPGRIREVIYILISLLALSAAGTCLHGLTRGIRHDSPGVLPEFI